ncbi:hypothetical protein JCM10908_006914 [Rhodotorula pacifica]|uniref:uncharacterized protein n=1 Tax=Rhodotorula pacifica TaxID=1495444 RepID=UPI0031783B63
MDVTYAVVGHRVWQLESLLLNRAQRLDDLANDIMRGIANERAWGGFDIVDILGVDSFHPKVHTLQDSLLTAMAGAVEAVGQLRNTLKMQAGLALDRHISDSQRVLDYYRCLLESALTDILVMGTNRGVAEADIATVRRLNMQLCRDQYHFLAEHKHLSEADHTAVVCEMARKVLRVRIMVADMIVRGQTSANPSYVESAAKHLTLVLERILQQGREALSNILHDLLATARVVGVREADQHRMSDLMDDIEPEVWQDLGMLKHERGKAVTYRRLLLNAARETEIKLEMLGADPSVKASYWRERLDLLESIKNEGLEAYDEVHPNGSPISAGNSPIRTEHLLGHSSSGMSYLSPRRQAIYAGLVGSTAAARLRRV